MKQFECCAQGQIAIDSSDDDWAAMAKRMAREFRKPGWSRPEQTVSFDGCHCEIGKIQTQKNKAAYISESRVFIGGSWWT